MMNTEGPDYWLFFYCREKKEFLRRRNIRKQMVTISISVQKLYDLYKSEKCAYCGGICLLNMTDSNKLKSFHATIDRVDPLIGYSDENIVLACNKCNQKKGKKDQMLVRLYGRKPREAA